MEVFTYLVDKDKNSVYSKYTTKETLKEKIIIRDEHKNNYIVFNTYDDYIAHWKVTPNNEKCFHEVIFGFKEQKIKFDLDILCDFDVVKDAENSADAEVSNASAKTYTTPDNLIYEINAIIEVIITQFYNLYNIHINYDNIILASSSGHISSKKWKYSFHIIINNYLVNDNEDAVYFTACVYKNLSEDLQKYIDINVNKKIQNFRLLGCKKSASLRFKKISEEEGFNAKLKNISYKDTIITNSDNCILLPKINTTELSYLPVKVINDKYINAAIQWMERNNLVNDHKIRCINGNIISYNRINNIEKCRICNRVHDNDNSLYIRVQLIKKNVISIIEYCHRSSPNKYNTLNAALNIADNIAAINTTESDNTASNGNNTESNDNSTETSYLQKVLNKVLLMSNSEDVYEGCIQTLYNSEYMEPYPIEPNTLCVKAPMGCGKTKALRDYLNNYFIDDIFPQTIRFLTFRQTFAKSLKSAFGDFLLYSDINGDINNNHKRVIIQVESLHRLVINSYLSNGVNLLILDEVESILAQFNSGLHRHFNAAFAIFTWMIANADKVICIDANLSERTINTLRRMRPKHNIYYHNNIFKKEVDNIYKLTNNNTQWLSLMFTYLKNDKRVVLPTNSISEAKIYKQLIEESFPNKKIQLYSSEMLISEKNEHFSNVEMYWSNLDVLIYTPTCSAGISFELDHFDVVFAYMTDGSCDVETCRQMLMRVRNVKSKAYYIYFPPYSANLGNYPTTIEDIIAQLRSRKLALYKDIDQTNLQFEYKENGDIVYFESNYYYLWLENIKIENLSKNNFIERFISHTVKTGAVVEIIPELAKTVTNAANATIRENYKNIKVNIKEMIATEIELAKDINQEELIDIQNRRLSQQDVQISELHACEKFYLKDTYKIKDNKFINKDFVILYNSEDVKKVFKYLSKICAYPTIEESLQELQKKDFIAHSSIGSFSVDMPYREGLEYCQLVKYKHSYTNHLSIQELIKICGFHFTDIFKKESPSLEANTINNNLRINLINIEKWLLLIIGEIKISKSFSDIKSIIKQLKNEVNIEIFIKKIIKLLNFGLRTFYGIEIKKNKDDKYSLLMWKTAMMFYFIIDNIECVDSNTEDIYKPIIMQNLLLVDL